MCGRASITFTWIMLQRHLAPFLAELRTESLPPIEPRYNIPPMADVPVVLEGDAATQARMMRWWLVPHWAKSRDAKYPTFNARSEGIDIKPTFREPFNRRRCLVPISGFYEWEKVEGSRTKRPHYIHSVDDELFCCAGVWDSWTDKGTGEVVESCSIITAPANKLLAQIHHRCPVILPPEQYAEWIDSRNQDTAALKQVLVPPQDDGAFAMHEVSTYVGNVYNDDVFCIKPVGTHT